MKTHILFYLTLTACIGLLFVVAVPAVAFVLIDEIGEVTIRQGQVLSSG